MSRRPSASTSKASASNALCSTWYGVMANVPILIACLSMIQATSTEGAEAAAEVASVSGGQVSRLYLPARTAIGRRYTR